MNITFQITDPAVVLCTPLSEVLGEAPFALHRVCLSMPETSK